MGGTVDIETESLGGLAAWLKERNGLGRSASLIALFDYLLQTSLEGRAAKEIEVADAVFGRGNDFDSMQDASVRVYAFRLRKKLDEFYAAEGADQPQRIVMLKGEYRLTVQPNIAGASPALPEREPALPAPAVVRPPRKRWRLWGGIAALVCASALAGGVIATRLLPTDSAAEIGEVRASSLWAPAIAEGAPLVVAIGDYYIFGETDSAGDVQRLVRDFSVNSRYDLDRLVLNNPALAGRYVDIGLNYYPIGVATALRDIIPVLRTQSRSKRPIRIVPVSQLTPHMIRNSNVVYIGYLSGLGALRDPLFNASHYAVGSSYDELVDKRSGQIFAASGTGTGTLKDLGYVASFTGPNGNRIIIIAGTRDAGLMQAADYAWQPAFLKDVDARTDRSGSFEALLKVTMMDGENLSGNLVSISPLTEGAAWQDSRPQDFPDAAQPQPAAPGGGGQAAQ